MHSNRILEKFASNLLISYMQPKRQSLNSKNLGTINRAQYRRVCTLSTDAKFEGVPMICCNDTDGTCS